MKMKMKIVMLKVLLMAILTLLSGTLPAQNTPTRMERDMKIFSTMLDEYMEKNVGKNNMFNNNTKIEYLDGFGVLVKVTCNNNWATRGKIWIDDKLDKIDYAIDKVIVEPITRVSTGNVKVRTTTKNGRTTITTNDNGNVSTIEFDEKDKDKRQKSEVKETKSNYNHSYNSDYQSNNNDLKQSREDQKQAKADIKRAKKDIERAKKDIERAKKDIDKAKREIDQEAKNNDRELRKEMKEAEKEMRKSEREMQESEKEMREAEKEMQKAEKEMQKEMAIYQVKEDSANKVEDAKTEAALKDFLLQYADLITELKPSERIRIMYLDGKQANGFDFSWSDGNTNGQAKVEESQSKGLEVFKKDIDNYKSSKNDNDFKARIKQITPPKDKESLKVALLAGVFDRVLAETKNDLIKTGRKTQFSYLEDYSLKYDSKMYFKSRKYEVNDCNCEDDKIAKTKSENDKNGNNDEETIIIKQQELIEKTAKEYLLLYGKTITSELKSNEKLIWEIEFEGKSKNPKVFEKMVFYVSKATLEDFDNRKISLEQAMGQVKTEKK